MEVTVSYCGETSLGFVCNCWSSVWVSMKYRSASLMCCWPFRTDLQHLCQWGIPPSDTALNAADFLSHSTLKLRPPVSQSDHLRHPVRNLQGVQPPTFSYFLGFLLLFPTFPQNSYFFLLFGSWRQNFFLFSVIFLKICNFSLILSKIFNFQVNFEDFRKFSWFWRILRKCPYFWLMKYLSYVQLLRL